MLRFPYWHRSLQVPRGLCRNAVVSRRSTPRRSAASGERRKRTVRIYSSLDGPPIDYVRGWAWQTVLLQQQLMQKNTPDEDALLLLEHKPVYTLGRGSDPRHLTVLESADNAEECIERLSTRGAAKSARLELSREMKQHLLLAQEGADTTTEASVDALVAAAAQPVYATGSAIPLYRVERGGEVTFHMPGQLVVYPLLHLGKHYRRDLHWYLHQMEQVVIDTLAAKHNYDGGIPCHRDAEHTGVWCSGAAADSPKKIAAVGVAASRWITTHGCALNVRQPDGDFLRGIQPCGIEGRGVTSIEEQQLLLDGTVAPPPTLHQVAQHVVETFERIFDVQSEPEHTSIR